MNGYRDWRLTLRLLSPLGTPMQSDTLFGHLCWQVALAEGDGAVAEFLEPFRRGQPPFVLSDAFPAGLLPRPLLPFPVRSATDRETYAARKRLQKAPYVTAESFLATVRSGTDRLVPVEDPWRIAETPHAAIDRRLNSTGGEDGEGRFYQTEAHVLAGNSRLEIYLRALPGHEERFLSLFRRISQLGFGRDKSTGWGAFEIEEFAEWREFQPVENAGRFVSLSTYIPSATDVTQGQWRLRLKRGFLSEHFVAGNPFKRPLLEIEPGAVFETGESAVQAFYGRLVPGIAPGKSEAVQFGFTLPVACRWGAA